MGTQHAYYHNFWASSRTSLKNLSVEICKELRKTDREFDAIACRGVSGTVVGAAVASRLSKQLIVVRKPDVQSHSEYDVEGRPYGFFKYIIIDDFVSTGETVREIIRNVEKNPINCWFDDKPICTGVFTYNCMAVDGTPWLSEGRFESITASLRCKS